MQLSVLNYNANKKPHCQFEFQLICQIINEYKSQSHSVILTLNKLQISIILEI